MSEKWLTLALLLVIIVLSGICVGFAVYFVKREKKLVGRIQKMLDDAIEGKFQDVHLDETKMSAVENSMWRYLCDNQVSVSKLSMEKEQIQTWISDISHQTVTPVANIVLYSQLLEEEQGVRENPEAAEEIMAIREQADKLDFLVESLVKLSRLEAGIIRVNVQRHKIGPVLEAVRNQFLYKASQKDIRLEVADSDETAVFDLKWTIEALANIVDNGIKYTPCKGCVSVSVESYSYFLRVNVEDNGMGIAETEQANIFTRFYRSSSVSEKPGLGIGLYLAREVMKAQDGYIKLSSKEGEGSVFSLFLLKDEMSQK